MWLTLENLIKSRCKIYKYVRYICKICNQQERKRWKDILEMQQQRMYRVTNNTKGQHYHNTKGPKSSRRSGCYWIGKDSHWIKEAAKETIRSILTLYHEKIQRIAALPNKDTATCSRCMSTTLEKESYW